MKPLDIERLARQSDFDYSFNGDILTIRDLDKGNKSVTNNIDNILAYINQFIPVSDYLVMYLDSSGIWDGVAVQEISGSFSCRFFPLNEKDYDKAVVKMNFLQL
ncbi:hypothetical protein [Rufibacter sp. XAAS-G3-1]|uniref:hypothetical protein n=1 Tax=Rufibacter sp. XAAS-G3-1 TaxID=2729134 RepID=UPI0015E684C9|nr:hypothetical protein [Rufibacter sp. XAAS-G3-1]